jgi:hypothetical protein
MPMVQASQQEPEQALRSQQEQQVLPAWRRQASQQRVWPLVWRQLAWQRLVWLVP